MFCKTCYNPFWDTPCPLVRPLEASLGPSCGPLGPLWGPVVALMSHLGTSMICKTYYNSLVRPLEVSLGPSCGPLGPIWGTVVGLMSHLGTS